MLRKLPLLAAALGCLSAVSLIVTPGPAGATLSFCSEGCFVAKSQELKVAYTRGQALVISCKDDTYACPDPDAVSAKVTVPRSTARSLGLPSTVVANGTATGPVSMKFGALPAETYYFVALRPAVERRFKTKKVHSVEVMVSATATGRDGIVNHFATRTSSWSDALSCRGPGLHIEPHGLIYGGHCSGS